MLKLTSIVYYVLQLPTQPETDTILEVTEFCMQHFDF